ncbi:MAG: coproporphyrinogen III oxidase, partial [Alphaproteobacteria bacterium]|nr:coproporphyrinogen III oxidase [Alphaproteobacteria bacterium]
MPPATDQNTVEEQKVRATAWFESLRDQICAAFEAIEDELTGTYADRPAGRFERTSW